MIIRDTQTHLDHGLLKQHIEWLLRTFGSRKSFFIETVKLPHDLPLLMCGLHGPIVGDAPISEDEVVYEVRNKREGKTRFVIRQPRPTSTITVIGGPDGDEPCVLYTAYGGPSAPREPFDTSLDAAGKVESEAFWKHHALSYQTTRRTRPNWFKRLDHTLDPALEAKLMSIVVQAEKNIAAAVMQGLPDIDLWRDKLPLEDDPITGRDVALSLVDSLEGGDEGFLLRSIFSDTQNRWEVTVANGLACLEECLTQHVEEL